MDIHGRVLRDNYHHMNKKLEWKWGNKNDDDYVHLSFLVFIDLRIHHNVHY